MIIQPRDTTTTPPTSGSGSSTGGLLGTGDDGGQFMQLLLTELQSQDPTQPMDTDSTVTQLVQLNLLDQVTQINSTVQSLVGSIPTGS
jgi:flagellar basal-body rod modification protein FlgD